MVVLTAVLGYIFFPGVELYALIGLVRSGYGRVIGFIHRIFGLVLFVFFS